MEFGALRALRISLLLRMAAVQTDPLSHKEGCPNHGEGNAHGFAFTFGTSSLSWIAEIGLFLPAAL